MTLHYQTIQLHLLKISDSRLTLVKIERRNMRILRILIGNSLILRMMMILASKINLVVRNHILKQFLIFTLGPKDGKQTQSKFAGNVHTDVNVPKNYKMTKVPSPRIQENTISEMDSYSNKVLSPYKKTNLRLDIDSDEENMPSNSQVQHALLGSSSNIYANVSIMDDIEADQSLKESKIDPRVLASFKSSIISKSPDSFLETDHYNNGPQMVKKMQQELLESNSSLLRSRRKNQNNMKFQNLSSTDEQNEPNSARRPTTDLPFKMTMMRYRITPERTRKKNKLTSFQGNVEDINRPYTVLKKQVVVNKQDANNLNKLYQNNGKKLKQAQHNRTYSKLQMRQMRRVKNHSEVLFGRFLDDDYDLDEEYF